MKWRLASAVLGTCAAILVAGGGSARATIITEDFSLSASAEPFSTGTASLSLPNAGTKFNPALGTLNSITVTLTGDFEVTGTVLGDLFFLMNIGVIGVLPVDVSVTDDVGNLNIDTTDTSAADLASMEGTGAVAATLKVTGSNPTSFTTTDADGLTGTLTYDYTPATAAAVPEPASLALFGGGLIALAFARRRRRATS